MSYVIGSWYKSEELAKRSCILHVRSLFRGTVLLTDYQCRQTAAAIGPIFSGFLQAVGLFPFTTICVFHIFIHQAAYDGLNGVGGLAGWRCVLPLSLNLFAATYYYTGLFIIDGIITVPIGLFGFLVMPGAACLCSSDNSAHPCQNIS